MNNVLNHDGKMLEETLAAFNSDSVKTSLVGLCNFKLALPLSLVFEKPLAISLSFCHMQQTVLRMVQ